MPTLDHEVYLAERSALGLSPEETLQTRRVDVSSVDLDRRLIYLSFSSETPVQRKFGMWEILSHQPGALDLEQLDRGTLPFLVDHDPQKQAGRIVGYRLSPKQNFATALIFDSPRGDLLLEQVQSGRTEISCRYRIGELELVEESVCMVKKWSLEEISSVASSCAADRSVGIGRGLSGLFQCVSGRELSEDEVAAELARIRLEWALAEEEERKRLRDEKWEKIQAEGYFLF
jgi:hypothetical protein